MTLYGSEEVYYVIGENKIADDLQGTLYGVKNIAGPRGISCKSMEVYIKTSSFEFMGHSDCFMSIVAINIERCRSHNLSNL